MSIDQLYMVKEIISEQSGHKTAVLIIRSLTYIAIVLIWKLL